MSRKITLLLATTLIFTNVIAQPWMDALTREQQQNFYEIQRSFNNYWKDKPKNERDSWWENVLKRFKNEGFVEDERPGYAQFKRWEHYWKFRINPDGSFPNPMVGYDDFRNYMNNRQQQRNAQIGANWVHMNPATIPASGGAGRINAVRVDPTNTSKLYVGSPSGGVWKTTNRGASWSTSTDALSTIGFTDMVIDYTNTNIIYAAGGDFDGRNTITGPDTYSAGVWKSIDGGLTWNITGLDWPVTFSRTISRLLMHPNNPAILFASSTNGLYKTTDAGVTWIRVSTAAFQDIEFKPSNPNIMYGSTGTDIRRSVNGGTTWSMLPASSGLSYAGVNGITLTVTPADTNIVYALMANSSNYGFNSIWQSTNGGVNWTKKTTTSTPNLLGWSVTGNDASSGGQAYYTLSLEASPINKNTLFVGGVNIWKSSDAGATWTCAAHWTGSSGRPYVHADIHSFTTFATGPSSYDLYASSDGGIFYSSNNGTNWTDLSNGLHIQQFYRLSCSQTQNNLVTQGAQDNGSTKYSNGTWTKIYGGDGMETLIDYSNANYIYISLYEGDINRSSNGGSTFSGISPPDTGAWVTPYVIDPIMPTTIYAALTSVWKSTNRGTNWTKIGNKIFSGNTIDALAVAPSNPNVMYASAGAILKKTTNGGTTWSTVTLSISGNPISYIAVDNNDPNKVWVSVGGFSIGKKVYKTTDAGITWTNISGTLPNLPANCIIQDKNGNESLYLATDVGVYYRDATMSDWIPFFDNLPNVRVDEIEIQYASQKIRAATYGRGLWESGLYVPTQAAIDAGCINIISPTGTICNDSIRPVITIKNFGLNALTSAVINYSTNGQNYTFNWTGNILAGASANITLPALPMLNGPYTFTASTSIPNGLSDGNNANDQASGNYTISGNGIALPYSEGFESVNFPPTGITIDNIDNGITWDRTTAASKSGVASAKMDNANYTGGNGQKDMMTLPALNLLSQPNPVLSFEIAYAYWTTPAQFSDTLEVMISTDCGQSFTSLYKKSLDELSTAAPQSAEFIPSSSEWRRDSIDLSAFANNSNAIIRFVNISDNENNIYLDDINIRGTDVTTLIKNNASQELVVWPNPSNGILNVNLPTTKISTLKITNALGETVKEINTSGMASRQLTLDLNDLANGIYYLNIMQQGERIALKKITLTKQ